jgi:hypothetical protein
MAEVVSVTEKAEYTRQVQDEAGLTNFSPVRITLAKDPMRYWSPSWDETFRWQLLKINRLRHSSGQYLQTRNSRCCLSGAG